VLSISSITPETSEMSEVVTKPKPKKKNPTKRDMPEKIVIRNEVVATVQKIITKAGLKFNLSAINIIVKQYYNPDKTDPKFKDLAQKAIQKLNSSSSKVVSDYKHALENVPPRKSKKKSKKKSKNVMDFENTSDE
jgi:metal-dependent amidase/aminoacylase/carboxypeptidase family protein